MCKYRINLDTNCDYDSFLIDLCLIIPIFIGNHRESSGMLKLFIKYPSFITIKLTKSYQRLWSYNDQKIYLNFNRISSIHLFTDLFSNLTHFVTFAA